MADFDTKQKRFSGMGMGVDEPPLLPDTDGTFDQADRQHFLDLYSGILADDPTPEEDAGFSFHARVGFPALRGYPALRRTFK